MTQSAVAVANTGCASPFAKVGTAGAAARAAGTDSSAVAEPRFFGGSGAAVAELTATMPASAVTALAARYLVAFICPYGVVVESVIASVCGCEVSMAPAGS